MRSCAGVSRADELFDDLRHVTAELIRSIVRVKLFAPFGRAVARR